MSQRDKGCDLKQNDPLCFTFSRVMSGMFLSSIIGAFFSVKTKRVIGTVVIAVSIMKHTTERDDDI